MEWKYLLSNKRYGQEQYGASTDRARSDFQRDYDRLIFSSPFRRLQNKTQVFPLPGSVFVHNRLTHSLEVASVARSMANIFLKSIRNLAWQFRKTLSTECSITPHIAEEFM